MPAEVIATVHQLAAACKKYKGITFTDKDGNIIKDSDDENNIEGNLTNNLRDDSEITGVDGEDGDDNDNNDEIYDETSQITGVPQTNIEFTQRRRQYKP